MSDDFKAPSELPTAQDGELLTPGSGLPPRTAACYASLLLLPGGVVFYCLDRKDPYVRYYAIQSIVISALGLMVHGIVLSVNYIFSPIWLIGWIFVWIVNVAYALFFMVWVVIWVITTINAYRGKKWHLPVLARVFKGLASRLP
jgi:uncharacterized membrane protein